MARFINLIENGGEMERDGEKVAWHNFTFQYSDERTARDKGTNEMNSATGVGIFEIKVKEKDIAYFMGTEVFDVSQFKDCAYKPIELVFGRNGVERIKFIDEKKKA